MSLIAIYNKQFIYLPNIKDYTSEFVIPTKESIISGIRCFYFGERLQIAGQTLKERIISFRFNNIPHRSFCFF